MPAPTPLRLRGALPPLVPSLALALLLCGPPGRAAGDEAGPPAGAPAPGFSSEAAFLGLSGVPVRAHDPLGGRPLRALSGLGAAWAATEPVRWGDLDPRPPDHPVARYDWQRLDDTLGDLAEAGLEPVLVLSPACPWASVPREETDYARVVRERLPAADAALVLAAAAGAAPPQPAAWKEWQRFVRDLLERYDGDGVRDRPGLSRPLRAVQVLERVERGARWLGSADEYLRLLHHVKEAAGEAGARVEVLHAAVDLHGLLLPGPDDAEGVRRRLRAEVPETPPLVRLEVERGLAQVERALDTPLAYDVLPVAGSGHRGVDERNVAALRRRLDARGSVDVPVWLMAAPTRRLEAATPGVPSPAVPAEEARLRAQRLAEALRAPEESPVRRWLRRGTAYDLVRGVAGARAAGAVRVLGYGLSDEPQLVPGEDGPPTRAQGFLVGLPGAAGVPVWRPTASWHAARQLNRLLLGHRTAQAAPLGAAGAVVVFGFGEQAPRPWVAVLLPECAPSWAGDLEGRMPERLVRVPLPASAVEIEEVALTEAAPSRRRVPMQDGLLELQLGTAPLYVLPAEVGR